MRRLIEKYPDGYVRYERERGLFDGVAQENAGLN